MRFGKFFLPSRNETATPHSRNIQFHFGFISRRESRGNFFFPPPVLLVSLRPFEENPHLLEQKEQVHASVGYLFRRRTRHRARPFFVFFALRFGLPSHAICNFPLGVFPPKLGPSTRKTVHRLIVQINRGGETTFFSLLAITRRRARISSSTKSVDRERVKR